MTSVLGTTCTHISHKITAKLVRLAYCLLQASRTIRLEEKPDRLRPCLFDKKQTTTTTKTEHFRYFQVIEFLQIKSDAETLRETPGFRLQLDGCKHKVVIAANVGTLERSCVCCVDAGLEAFECQDEAYLIVHLPIKDMPGCCPRQHVGVESVGKGELVALCEL